MSEKTDQAVNLIGNILDSLNQEERDEVTLRVTEMMSSHTLSEGLFSRSEKDIADGEALQEQRDSHGLESFIPAKINDPEWDPNGPEDGGHPY